MSKCKFNSGTGPIGSTFKRHQYEDGKCKRCGRDQFVKIKLMRPTFRYVNIIHSALASHIPGTIERTYVTADQLEKSREQL